MKVSEGERVRLGAGNRHREVPEEGKQRFKNQTCKKPFVFRLKFDPAANK